ncbi:MAG: Isomerizing Glutamine-fructose-6-phosphate aminotransferase [Candidatus Levybacteria bacterium GW2011_GWB1_37_8]|nr:MAG: Isomerizing Glutamine-fructose-6-phosphate aminotransferase [Candidatus Levybacteria bacterium GW2011_GWB1_37_8]
MQCPKSAVSKEIVAAKTGSPLICGIGDEELLVASDASAIVKHTKKVIFLEDNQMVILGEKLKLISLPDGKEIKSNIHTLDWEFEDAKKGKFKHFLLKEISEQPRVIENIVLNYAEEINHLAKLIKEAFGTFMLGLRTT